MLQSSLIIPSRWLFFPSHFSRYLSTTNRLSLKDFDKKTFDYFYTRRLEIFNGNNEQMSNHLHTNLESLFQTSSLVTHLTNFNSKTLRKPFSQTISINQLNDILFFAYKHNLKLHFFTRRLIECVSPIPQTYHPHFFLELINLLVLHQQKHYDHQTKTPNQILQKLINHLELSLTKNQIEHLSLTDLSLLSSAMYRLQISLKNPELLQSIARYLINDEKQKSLSAVDKQNFIKILTLSNYGRIDIAEALANRFNQSFEQHIQSDLNSFSYEIVRMTMRIAIYFSFIRFYSHRFFDNCLKLMEFESNAMTPSYRAKDIIRIMNTLISMGYIRKTNSKYLELIDIYDKMGQFDGKPERLVDVLAPFASIEYFPEDLLEKVFTNDNLKQLNGRRFCIQSLGCLREVNSGYRWANPARKSRMKEKLFFISQSYKLLCSSQKSLLNQNYLDSLPHHLFGSWEIEKRKRPYFSIVMQRLLECLPNRLYVKSAFLLRHFKSPDIIIRLNTEQQPQIISNEMKKSIGFFDENEKECSMYALEVLSEEELCANEPFRPLGLFYSKARQLQKLNYIPVIIYPNDSLHQVKTTTEVFQWIIQRAETTKLLLHENY